MWFLEHEIITGGKRTWLRPGSQLLYGRTKASGAYAQDEGRQVYIDNKNVSRKHMMIKVLEVPPSDGTKLHSRSQVEITDLSCRQGTSIDDRILKSSKAVDGTLSYDKTVLSGTEHTIYLSQSYPPFKIKWQPVVITYASKESSDSKVRSTKLHSMDIRTSTEFVYDKTTHVVSTKRNLPKVLQALVSGKPIVTAKFFDTVLEAATSSIDSFGNYTPSQLEKDFETYWPNEDEHIPSIGAEPVSRPEQMLKPDPSRSEVFSGLTFVFLDATQFNSLQDPIGGGGGKALLFDVRPGKTTVEEYVNFIFQVAGQKKRSKENNGKLPVITVRLSLYPDDFEDWAFEFVIGVDRSLNQRSILQNEFLDAIISKDTSPLMTPPTEETMDIYSSAPSLAEKDASTSDLPAPTLAPKAPSPVRERSPAPTQEPAKSIPRKRPIRRAQTASRFTGFDDYEPPPKARKIEGSSTPMENIQESVPIFDIDAETQRYPSVPATQLRVASPFPTERNTGIPEPVEESLSSRSRRTARRAASASVEPETQQVTHRPKSKAAVVLEQAQKATKPIKDINVREHTRLRIKEEEDKRKANEDSLREALEGVDISEMKHLAQVKEMEVKPRKSSVQRGAEHNERWNDEWNGRKNFKKFRRRGADKGLQPQKVLVTLEKAPPKGSFNVAEIFLEKHEPVRSREDERRLKRRIGPIEDDDSEPEPGFTRRKRTKATEVVTVEDSDPDGEDSFPDRNSSVPKNTSSARIQRIPETQIEELQTQTQRGTKKRVAVTVAAGQPSTKNGRAARRDEDSDEEETGFRFRRRG